MTWKVEFHISRVAEGKELLAMFRIDDPTEDDMGSDIDLLLDVLEYDDGTEEWFVAHLCCSNPNIDYITDLLIQVCTELKERGDITTLSEVIDLCNSIGTPNPRIFSYRYST